MSAEHSRRWEHKTVARPTSHWGKTGDLTPHPGPVASCGKCRTRDCSHWGHEPGEWKYSCCACSGIPDGCGKCSSCVCDEPAAIAHERCDRCNGWAGDL